MNYETAAKAIIALFSLVWIVAVLKAFFVVGFSVRMLMNSSFLLMLLAALLIPIAAVWALFIFFNK